MADAAAASALRSAIRRLEVACCNAAQILNVTRQEWSAVGAWSDWDEATLAELSAARTVALAAVNENGAANG